MAVKTSAFKRLSYNSWHSEQTNKIHTILDSEHKYCLFCRAVMNDDLSFLFSKGLDLSGLLDKRTWLVKSLNSDKKHHFNKGVKQDKDKIKKIDKSLNQAKYFLSKSSVPKFLFPLLCTVVRRRGIINAIINGNDSFFASKHERPILHSRSYSKMTIKMLTTGLSSDPVQQINNASKRLKLLANSVNFAYDVADFQKLGNLHMYMLTLTVPNVNLGQLRVGFRGKPSRSKGHYHGGLKTKVNSLRKWIYRHSNVDFRVIGGFQDFEATVNRKLLNAHCSKGLFHPHAHLLLLSSQSSLNNDENYSNKLWHEWNRLNKGYWSENLSKKAFDFEEVYSPNHENNSFDKAISEASKYVVKPDFYKRLTKSSDFFQQRVFAELLNATYSFHAKTGFGYVRKATTAINKFGAFKTALTSVMDLIEKYNLSHKVQFPDIVTQVSYAHFNRGPKLHYVQLNKNRPLTPCELLYFNRNLIAGSVASKDQRIVLTKLSRSSGLLGRYVSRWPYFTTLGFMSKLKDVANQYRNAYEKRMFKYYISLGNSYGLKHINSYYGIRSAKASLYKYRDVITLYNALESHVMPDGCVHLGLTINPDFKFKLMQWVDTFLSELDKVHLRFKGWYQYATGDAGLTSKEQKLFDRAHERADKSFGGIPAPQPANRADPDNPGHYFAYRNSYCMLKGLGYPHSVNELNYNQLIPEEVEECNHADYRPDYWYDPSGYGFDFSLTSDEPVKGLKNAIGNLDKQFRN